VACLFIYFSQRVDYKKRTKKMALSHNVIKATFLVFLSGEEDLFLDQPSQEGLVVLSLMVQVEHTATQIPLHVHLGLLLHAHGILTVNEQLHTHVEHEKSCEWCNVQGWCRLQPRVIDQVEPEIGPNEHVGKHDVVFALPTQEEDNVTAQPVRQQCHQDGESVNGSVEHDGPNDQPRVKCVVHNLVHEFVLAEPQEADDHDHERVVPFEQQHAP